jgi:hypothetical protein
VEPQDGVPDIGFDLVARVGRLREQEEAVVEFGLQGCVEAEGIVELDVDTGDGVLVESGATVGRVRPRSVADRRGDNPSESERLPAIAFTAMDPEANARLTRRRRRVLMAIGLTGWAVSAGLFLVHLFGLWAGPRYAGFETASGLTLVACFSLLALLADRILRLRHAAAFAGRGRLPSGFVRRGVARLYAWVSALTAFGVMAILLSTLGLPDPMVAFGCLAAGFFAAALFMLEDRQVGRAHAPGRDLRRPRSAGCRRRFR